MFVVIASIVLTVQITRLEHQLRAQTLKSEVCAICDETGPYDVQLNSFSIRRTVLGLTWGAVLASVVGIVGWAVERGAGRRKGPSV